MHQGARILGKIPYFRGVARQLVKIRPNQNKNEEHTLSRQTINVKCRPTVTGNLQNLNHVDS